MGTIEYLYHYYEEDIGPFVNLSDISTDRAEEVLSEIRNRGETFASKRSPDYLVVRRELEQMARKMFIEKGGKPKRDVPHYMTLGSCPWLYEWYKNGKELKIHIEKFNAELVSFTYGDLFPTMRYNDGKPYRGKVFTKEEIFEVIKEFGLPQEWNKDGKSGPERYIEAQVWDNRPLGEHISVKKDIKGLAVRGKL